jgi:predicted nucleotidyltransferase
MDSSLILTDLKESLQKRFLDSVKNVILFGSRIKSSSNEYSDYDILILLNKDYLKQDEEIILDICYDIDLKYNILIDAHLLSTNEISTRRGKQPIFINALKNGIYV